jgi:outer membrane protein assembly factor BamA
MRWFFTFMLLGFLGLAMGQKRLHVRDIHFVGNERTKMASIHRELDFRPGDSLFWHELPQVLGRNENRLLNTGLFYEVSLQWVGDSLLQVPTGDIWVYLKEYNLLSAGFAVELADRNFNIWLQEKNHLLDRLNFRLSSRLNNVDGKNQRIELVTQLGYTELIALSQQFPFINRDRTVGFSWFALASRNRELNYNTLAGKQAFQVDPGQFLFTRLSGGLAWHYRGHHVWRHRLELRFHQVEIADFVNDSLNKDFFLGEKMQRYEELNYFLTYENRDRIIYPTQGSFAEFFLNKRGVFLNQDVDLLFVGGEYQHYWLLGKKWSYKGILKGRLAVQRAFPGYFQYRALGERNNTLRGFELFVFEGLDYAYLKQSIRRQVLGTSINWFYWLPFSRYRHITLEVFAAANLDVGYVHEPFRRVDNALVNQWLAGGGLGLDFVLMGDKLIRLELSSNQKGLTGVYLHTKFGIHPRLTP